MALIMGVCLRRQMLLTMLLGVITLLFPPAIVAIHLPQAASDMITLVTSARTRLALLKTGHCGSSLLMHELVKAACPHGHEFEECYAENWNQEVLYPFEYMHKSRVEVAGDIEQVLGGISTCAGENASCGWSLCLSCSDLHDLKRTLKSDYWQAIANVIVANDMQVLLMTRDDAVDWAVTQALADKRVMLMSSSPEFRALRAKPIEGDDNAFHPCTAFTLDGCSSEQMEWINSQSVALDMDKVEYFVDYHKAANELFQQVKQELLARNEHQRIMWVTLEDLSRRETWEKVYAFAGLPLGEVPEMHAERETFAKCIENWNAIEAFAEDLRASRS
eukprot:TRINITY_DN37334_c0_g1_i1.p2 TRINITY_DN37334_c0_g1~~TRINITY_DN37334_c0_g1_i1.p2  ORF type:complete len:333 (-),score=61.81 TRINITY_DN37334_c0_g1_i1:34-1032(-)